MEQTDVAIIGAGPIGLELAVALQRARVAYIQFDAGQVGQTITWYPRQARFFSSPERIAIAGVPLQVSDQAKASREEYLAYLRGVAQMFDLQVRTYERVTSMAPDSKGFTLRTRRGDTDLAYHARRVVVAIGDMHRPRTLDIPGEDLAHVSHYFVEPHAYFRQRLLIVGGRNSAIEAAIRCQRAGAHVELSYRGEAFDAGHVKYWLLPEVQSLIKSGKIVFHPHTVPVRIAPAPAPGSAPAPGTLSVTLRRTDRDEAYDVAADFVLLLVGYVMDPGLLQGAGVELQGENRAPAFDPQTMQTNVPGLYVAGTAAAGTQVQFRLFIENAHVHVDRIVASILGHPPPTAAPAGPQTPLET